MKTVVFQIRAWKNKRLKDKETKGMKNYIVHNFKGSVPPYAF
ncbi:MAG TPA: hypothetical protein PLF32_05200 [Bacteroidales bacterium]|nr:hypothetical protein [Bacteroidales bacterium]HOR82031.1 hypothetical protein [Bacteroidales bacterium]HPJ91307.1 hypothetical protein [Bacteroidales bacterium]